MEVIADCVVHEALLCLGFTPCLILKDHVVVPPVEDRAEKEECKTNTTTSDVVSPGGATCTID